MSNRHRNIQALLIEVFKMKNGLVSPIMGSVLNMKFNTYNPVLRSLRRKEK